MLWASSAASNLADGVVFAGLPVVALRLTDRPVLVSGVTIALMLPMALAALPSGVLVDRADRRRLLVVGNLVRACGLAAVLGAVLAGETTIALVYAAAAIAGGTETLVDTASQSAVPSLVERADLPRAHARLGATQVLLHQALGAPVGSFVAGVGIGASLGVPAVLFAVAALLARRLSLPAPARGETTSGASRRPRSELRDGLHTLVSHPVLRPLAAANGAANLGNSAFASVFVLFVVGPLGLPPETYGWFLTALATGGVLGSIGAGAVLSRLGHVPTIRFASLLTAGTYLVAATSTRWQVVGACACLLGAASMVWNVAARVLRQTLVPDALLGRVTATMTLVALLTTPLGALAGGVIAEIAGVRGAGWLAALANLGAFVCFSSRSLRRRSALTATDGASVRP